MERKKRDVSGVTGILEEGRTIERGREEGNGEKSRNVNRVPGVLMEGRTNEVGRGEEKERKKRVVNGVARVETWEEQNSEKGERKGEEEERSNGSQRSFGGGKNKRGRKG